jgi:hypothetical protein
VARSAISAATKKKTSPFDDKIKSGQEGYTVASAIDNKAVSKKAFSSEALAREYMQEQIAKDPNLKEGLHVIPQHETNTAA